MNTNRHGALPTLPVFGHGLRPKLWDMQSEAPWLLVALAADVRERNKVAMIADASDQSGELKIEDMQNS